MAGAALIAGLYSILHVNRNDKRKECVKLKVINIITATDLCVRARMKTSGIQYPPPETKTVHCYKLSIVATIGIGRALPIRGPSEIRVVDVAVRDINPIGLEVRQPVAAHRAPPPAYQQVA